MYESGVMVIFGKMFRDIAEKETRVITTFDDPKLGSESYALVDVYCVAPDCDCRRVMINVIRDRDAKHLATINWAFDKDDPDRGPFLDRLNAQSPLSDALLKMVKETVLPDKRYVERLERHYRMVKEAVADPNHEVHKVLTDVTRKSPENSKKMKATFVAASTDAELAGLWREVGLDVPPELVEETIRRGERMVPYLGRFLLDEAMWAAGPEDDESWAPPFALALLSAIGGSSVTPFATEFLRRGMGGDWLTDLGDKLVYSLGPEAVLAIWDVATDERADEWGRSCAIGGLCLLGLKHEPLRADLVARFRSLTDAILAKPPRKLSEADSVVLDELLDALGCLHDEDSRERIERAFAEPRFKLHPPDKQETFDLMKKPFEEVFEESWSEPLGIFQPEELEYLRHANDPSAHEEDDDSLKPIVRESGKVGRNDPCPCASGKKYKKCCLPT